MPRVKPFRSSDDVQKKAGISYRQLQYWVSKGYLTPKPRPGTGPGYDMDFEQDEMQVAIIMGKLVAAGLVPEAAHHAARHDGVIAEGIRVVIEATVE